MWQSIRKLLADPRIQAVIMQVAVEVTKIVLEHLESDRPKQLR